MYKRTCTSVYIYTYMCRCIAMTVYVNVCAYVYVDARVDVDEDVHVLTSTWMSIENWSLFPHLSYWILVSASGCAT